MKKKFKFGQPVLYKPLDTEGKPYKEQSGIVKRMGRNGKVAFVWYHEGCTTAATPVQYLELTEETKGHKRIHRGCSQCNKGDPQGFMEILFDSK